MTRQPSIKKFAADGKEKHGERTVFPCLAKMTDDKVRIITKRKQMAAGVVAYQDLQLVESE